jgi:hypothetical protein
LEWIDSCVANVVRAQVLHGEAAKNPSIDPEPEQPNATMSKEEANLAENNYQEWCMRSLFRTARLGARGGIERAAKAQAFLAYLPPLTNRANTKAFIACLAVGLQRKYLTPEEVKHLMYTAQLALQAYRPRTRSGHAPLPPRVSIDAEAAVIDRIVSAGVR